MSDIFAERFSIAIAQRRKKRDDLARELKTSRYRIYRLQRGAEPTVDELKTIAASLQVSVEFLIGESHELPGSRMPSSDPRKTGLAGSVRPESESAVAEGGETYGVPAQVVMGFLAHVTEWYFRQRLLREPTVEEFKNQVELAIGQVARGAGSQS
ncbi:MAG: helix-turn-helix transcriptional regulator [Planctomycetes bacterium]|nr:helix-turn-helix transcriptional regulator [Planctomycetota bacterium]